MPSFTISSADEYSPLESIFPNLSTSEEMSVIIARIAELNRANTVEPSIASSADLFGQDGNGSDDNEFSLDDEDGQKKEESEMPTNEAAAEERFSQFQNDHKKLLEKISELEKQQKEQSKATENQLSKMLEKISEFEKKQKQQQNKNMKNKATLDQLSMVQIDQMTQLENVNELEKALLNFRQNYWATNVCYGNLKIIGEKNLTVHHKGNEYGCCSVFAKYPIFLNNNSSDIFYYEISIKNKKFWVVFGFAVKQQTKLELMIKKGTNYAYDSYGDIWINEEVKGRNAQYSYGVGDTVGIGFNSSNRQIFFTKNGLRLDFSKFFVVSSFADDFLHPFVSLCSFNDQIEANFGPNFKFDLTTL
ncbi:hypothetical protein niasHT_000160 [Heterodera trifolii]|uniref:B30.2/SPRY domain-containing protein n=1 Tax=Heterodera trifolii TaxID=157864 RepID=A0ABD2LQK1_9BILA